MANEKTLYLQCEPSACAPSVVLVGDPARIELFAAELTEARTVAQEREFTTITGKYQNLPISVVSMGIGAPAAAIVLEELWELGARLVVRAGTMMALNATMGDFVLAQGAVRFDGVSTTYLPLEFPALADADLFFTFKQVLEQADVPYRAGLVASSDGFYTELFHHGVPGREPHREDVTIVDYLKQHRVLAVDMETSAIYTVSQALGIRCASLCVTTVAHTRAMMEAPLRLEKEKQLARLVLSGLHEFAQRPA